MDLVNGRVATLGRGRWAEVIAVRDLRSSDSRLVAVKVYRREDALRRSERVIQEKKSLLAVASSCSRYVVKLIETLKDDESLYFVQTPVLGGALHRHVFRASGGVPMVVVQAIAAELVSALRHLSSCGVVHRDFKLNNILLNESGHAVLCDFSSSKVLYDAGELDARRNIVDINKSFTITGSLHIMAPEMAAETGHNFSVDWWALGVVVFEMISGAPFPWNNRENDESVRAAASFLLENVREAPGMQGCWDCREIPILTFDPDELASMRRAALDLVRSLLIPDPLRRCDTIIQEPGQSQSVERFFTRLESHAFFQGVSWPCVHCGLSPSPWPDFDHRLGFLQILQGGEDAEEISKEQQELFYAF